MNLVGFQFIFDQLQRTVIQQKIKIFRVVSVWEDLKSDEEWHIARWKCKSQKKGHENLDLRLTELKVL